MTVCAGFLLFAVAACKPQVAHSGGNPRVAMAEQTVDEFKTRPTEENLKKAEAALAKLEAEIKDLEVHAAKSAGAEKSETQAKLDDLKTRYTATEAEFTAARVTASVNKAGEATGRALDRAGEAVKNTKDTLEDQFRSETNR